MKKAIALTLIVCAIFSLTGCKKIGLDFSSTCSESNVLTSDEERPIQSKKSMIDFIGSTLSELEAELGTNYIKSVFYGIPAIRYVQKDLVFAFEIKGSEITKNDIVFAVLSDSEEPLADKICANVTYDEIVDAVGDAVKLPKPKFVGENESGKIYELVFVYNECTITYNWCGSPYGTKSYQVTAEKIDSDQSAESSSSQENIPSQPEQSVNDRTPPNTTPGITSSTVVSESQNSQELANQICEFLKTEYFKDRGILVYGVEIYTETENMLVLTIKTNKEYEIFGVDYYKDTKTLEFYKTGELKIKTTFPKD